MIISIHTMYVLLLPLLFQVCVIAQRIPNSVSSVEAYQMSPTVVFLRWVKPVTEFDLTNYDVQYAEIQNGLEDSEDFLCAVDGNDTQDRVKSVRSIFSYAKNLVIEFPSTIVDVQLRGIGNYVPSTPDFEYRIDKPNRQLKVTWTPKGNFPGDRFYVSYKTRDERIFSNTKVVDDKFDVVISNLIAEEVYLIYIVVLYGKAKTESIIKEIYM